MKKPSSLRFVPGIFLLSALVLAVLVAATSGVGRAQASGKAEPASDAGLGTTPDYSGVDDILGGQRRILAINDLVAGNPQSSVRETSATNLTFAMDREQVVNFTTAGVVTAACKVSLDGQPLPQQTRFARLFDLPDDVNVTLAPTVTAAGTNCTGSDNMAFYVKDALNGGNDSTTPLTLSANWLQSVVADFNQDGYDDIFFMNDELAAVAGAQNVSDPSQGLQIKSSTSITGLGVAMNTPAVGDFDGDGNLDVAWVGADPVDGQSLKVRFATVCSGRATATGPCAGKNAFDIVLSDKTIAVDATVDSSAIPSQYPPVAVTAGEYVPGTTGLIVVSSTQTSVTVSLYAFGSDLTATKKSAFTVNVTNPDAVLAASGPLDWFGGSDQAVVAWNPLGQDARLTVISVGADFKMDQWTSSLANEDGNRTLLGLALGRYTQQLTPVDGVVPAAAFNLDIATLFGSKRSQTESTLGVYTLPQGSNGDFSPNLASRLSFDMVFGAATNRAGSLLNAGDRQGLSMRLGPPEVLRVTGRWEPMVILGAPPKFADYVASTSNTAPTVFNVSGNLSGFYTTYTFSQTQTAQSATQQTTSYSWSTKESTAQSFKYKVPLINSIAGNFKQSWTQTNKETVEEKFNTYSTQQFNFAVQTGIGDVLRYWQTRLNYYFYPIVGQKACPADDEACDPNDPTDGEPLYVMVSGPDESGFVTASGSTSEIYQPVHSPLNLFSYPWNLTQLQKRFSGFDQLSVADTTKTDDSTQTVSWKWSQGQGTEQKTGTVVGNSFGSENSLTGTVGDVSKTGGGAVSGGFSYSESSALRTVNTGSLALGESTGIQLAKPGTFPTPALYEYPVQAYIFGQTNPDVVQEIDTGSDVQTQGPLQVAYTADPARESGADAAGSWWLSNVPEYGRKPDLAFAHPVSWELQGRTLPSNETLSPNCLRTKTGDNKLDCAQIWPPDAGEIWTNPFYHMRGLYLTVGSTDGPQRIQATAGDVIWLQARLYNYSFAEMPPGTKVKVRFYRQEWDTSRGANTPIGDSVLINEVELKSPIPAFDSVATPNAANWALASTSWDTGTCVDCANKSYVFWVIAWMEDGAGHLVDEVQGHGLAGEAPPGTLTSIVDAQDLLTYEDVDACMVAGNADQPCGVSTQKVSFTNNVGFYKRTLYLAPPTGSATAAESAPSGDLSLEEVTAEKPLGSSPGKYQVSEADIGAPVEVAAELTATADDNAGGQLVAFYDLPGGAVPGPDDIAFDTELSPYVPAGETHEVLIHYQPQTCGERDIWAVVDPNSSRELKDRVDLRVPCPPVAALEVRKGFRKRHGRRPAWLIRLDAGGSQDPDGSIVAYRFKVVDEKTKKTVFRRSSRKRSSVAAVLASGKYLALVTVKDNEGGTDFAEHRFTLP